MFGQYICIICKKRNIYWSAMKDLSLKKNIFVMPQSILTNFYIRGSFSQWPFRIFSRWMNYDFRVISRTHLRFVASFACDSQRRSPLLPSLASRRNALHQPSASSDRRRIFAHRGKVATRPGARRFSPVTWLKTIALIATVHQCFIHQCFIHIFHLAFLPFYFYHTL